MKIINVINELKNDQYLETTNDPSNPLRRVDKPEFICLFSQALEFCKVLKVVKEALERPLDKDDVNSALLKLSDRYTSFTQHHSSFALMLTSFFLWVLGYRGEDSFDLLAKRLELNYAQKTSFYRPNTHISDEELKFFSSKYSSPIKKINLDNCYRITDKGIKAIALKWGSTVEEIDFKGTPNVTCTLIPNVFPALKTVKLSHLKSDEIVEIIDAFTKSGKLRTIALESCVILDENLQALSEKCSKIESITFYCCNISYEGTKAFINTCPALKKISLLGSNIEMNSHQLLELEELVQNRT